MHLESHYVEGRFGGKKARTLSHRQKVNQSQKATKTREYPLIVAIRMNRIPFAKALVNMGSLCYATAGDSLVKFSFLAITRY